MPRRKYKKRGRRTLAAPPRIGGSVLRRARPAWANPAAVSPSGATTATQMEKLLANRGAEIGITRARKPVQGSKREQTVPQETPKSTRSGAHKGGRGGGRGGNSTYIPPQHDIKEPRSYVQYHGNFTTKVIELPANMMPAPPINLSFKVKQNGNPKRLDNWKGMYPATTLELNSPYQEVGGANVVTNKAKLSKTTACGFNRSNVHYPSAWRDYVYRRNGKAPDIDAEPEVQRAIAEGRVAPVPEESDFRPGFSYGALDILACRASNFNRYQLEEMFWQGYFDYLGTSASINWQNFLTLLEDGYTGGDQKYYFPLSSVTTEYTYSNRNVATDLNMSIYICTPKRHLTCNNDPMGDWVEWFNQTGKAQEGLGNYDGIKMDPSYAFEPIITGDVNQIGTITRDGKTQVSTPVANCDKIITLSTEVVPEASPHGFSQAFRHNWEIIDVKHVKLMPQQTLNFTVTTELTEMLDLQEMFTSSEGGTLPGVVPSEEKIVMYKGLTIIPMVKFWGSPVSGESSGQVFTNPDDPKSRTLSSPDVNRVLATTQAQSSAAMMTQTQRSKCRIHAKNTIMGVGENNLQSNVFEYLFDNMTNKQRKLLPVGSPIRGQEGAYYQVNDHIGYFCNLTEKPADGEPYFTSNVALLNSRTLWLTGTAEPSRSQLLFQNVSSNWDYIETETVSRMQLVKTGSDAGKNNDN